MQGTLLVYIPLLSTFHSTVANCKFRYEKEKQLKKQSTKKILKNMGYSR